ncbi:hypothetical protein PHYBOEH_009157 [Phytophthora boehmeriae]|uniref:Uncharacterized protein n=1 Tax=Phytophthora boehmeriae TaxID=109152 RepID=A0A8T1X0I8_9STRA|nr:hypothetical protein PHYBOEH_009157 [Phytophthora boehmeriae]
MLSSAKSLDDEAARLAVLRDPKRMASLLVRAFSSSIVEAQTASAQQEEDEEVEETQEEFEELEEEAQRESEGPLRVVVHSAAEEDEDDADEEEEEAEEEAEEEEQREDRPLDEDELEAAATALETATRIVEELRLKMLLKAEKNGEKLPQEASESTVVSTGSAVMTPSQFLRSESNISTGRPGTPVPQARVRSNSMCPTCNKSFNAFHRSKNCSASLDTEMNLYVRAIPVQGGFRKRWTDILTL